MNFPVIRFKGYKLPFFLLLMLVFATVMLGDNAAESLLLAQYDASLIAKLFSLNALFLFLFSLFMISLIDRINRSKLFTRFLMTHATILTTSWLAIQFGAKAVVIPLFSYAYVSKIFIFLLFWTLANDIVDSRKAARDFPKIAAGGTLGAIGISFLIPFIVSSVPAETLLLVWAVLTLSAAALFQPIGKQFGRAFLPASLPSTKENKIRQIRNDVLTIGRDPLLKSMAFFYFLLFFVLLNQQYGFYQVLNERYSDATDLSRFLGLFTGTSMAVTFLLQITLSSWVIRRIGSTRAMFILPLVFTAVFLSLRIAHQYEIAQVLFWGTVTGLGLRIAVFDSFYSPNFQIFFSSLPKEIRGRGKIALEGVVKPASMIIASLWLTLIMPKLPVTAATTILVGASITMIFLTFKMRKQYTRSLTRYLMDFRKRKATDADELFRSRDVVPRIRELFDTESYEVQCYLIELLADIDCETASEELIRLLSKANQQLLPKVILALAPLARQDMKEQMTTYLSAHDPAVVSAAARAVAEYEGTTKVLLPFLTSPSQEIQFTVLELLWWRVTQDQRNVMVEEIAIHLNSSLPSTLFDTLDFCGRIDDPKTTELIPKRFPDFNDPILESHYAWKRFATALSDLEGESILLWIMNNAHQCGEQQLRSLIPAVENIIKTGLPIEKIIRLLEKGTLPQRFLLSNGLALWGRPQKKFSQRLRKMAEAEFAQLRNAEKQFCHAAQLTTTKGELLTTAINEELLTQHRHTAIALASLLDHTGEIRQVADRLHHDNSHIRSQALEVLDNAGDRKINRTLISHLSPPKSDEEVSHERVLATVKDLTTSDNSWVAECAHYTHNYLKDGASNEQ